MKARYPLPDSVSFKARLQAALGDPEGAASAMVKDRTAALMKQYGVTRAEALPLDLNGIRLQVGEDHGYEIFDRFYGELFDPMEAQNRFLQSSSVLFPLLGVQALSMGLAGTDLAQHRDFIRAAEEHRRAEIKIINDDILDHPGNGKDVHLGERDLWTKVPPFHYDPPGIGWVLTQHAPALALLAAWFVFAAWCAWSSAAHLRPV